MESPRAWISGVGLMQTYRTEDIRDDLTGSTSPTNAEACGRGTCARRIDGFGPLRASFHGLDSQQQGRCVVIVVGADQRWRA